MKKNIDQLMQKKVTRMKETRGFKVDIVMWTKDSARFLPITLKRIDEVIPNEFVNQKIIVDDHSQDNTVHIASDFHWSIYLNPKTGISSGANEALRHVKSNFFISVEHDVILAKNWWDKIPTHMSDPAVAVAQGVRVATNRTLRVFDMARVKSKDSYCIIDNNIYNTKIIRSIGGFPNDPISTDLWLKENVLTAGFKWITDHSVISLHIRQGVLQEGKHLFEMVKRKRPEDEFLMKRMRHLMKSPLVGLKLAIKERQPLVIPAHTYLQLMKLRGSIYAKAKCV